MYTPTEWRTNYHTNHKPCDSDGEPLPTKFSVHNETRPTTDIRYLYMTPHCTITHKLTPYDFTRLPVPTFIDFEEPTLIQLMAYFETLSGRTPTVREKSCLMEIVVARELHKFFSSITFHDNRHVPHMSRPGSRWRLPDGRCVTLPGWDPLGSTHSHLNKEDLRYPTFGEQSLLNIEIARRGRISNDRTRRAWDPYDRKNPYSRYAVHTATVPRSYPSPIRQIQVDPVTGRQQMVQVSFRPAQGPDNHPFHRTYTKPDKIPSHPVHPITRRNTFPQRTSTHQPCSPPYNTSHYPTSTTHIPYLSSLKTSFVPHK